MDKPGELHKKEESIPLIKMATSKGKMEYGRTISSIGDPKVRQSSIINYINHFVKRMFYNYEIIANVFAHLIIMR